MKHFDLTQPTPDDRMDELQGQINDLCDIMHDIETSLICICVQLNEIKEKLK